MSLDQRIADYLAAADVVPARSKLEPYRELIRGLRQKRWTYQRISRVLRVEFGVSAAPSTIHHFQQVRAKKCGGTKVNPSAEAVAIPAAKRPRFKLDA